MTIAPRLPHFLNSPTPYSADPEPLSEYLPVNQIPLPVAAPAVDEEVRPGSASQPPEPTEADRPHPVGGIIQPPTYSMPLPVSVPPVSR
jgi:hypothetical protein